MPTDDHDEAMKMVIENMGRHARLAKARRYAPKRAETPPPDAHNMGTGEMSEADLQHLLNIQRSDKDDELEVQR